MIFAKHLLITLAMFAAALPLLWPLTRIEDAPVSTVTWALVVVSALANGLVIVYHYTVPPHPKFLMVWWRRAILRVHITSGTLELGFGLWALLSPGTEIAGFLMAVTALGFHVPSALAQTPIVFGSRAIMRPSYLACIGLHAFCAIMLLQNPAATYWVVVTFLIFNVYVWCRLYFYAFDKFGVFSGSKYSVAILAAGLTTIPALLGEATMVVLAIGIGTYILLYSAFFIRSRGQLHEFVRERARDGAYSEGVLALWDQDGGADDEKTARAFFDQLDADRDGLLHTGELTGVLSQTALSSELLRRFLNKREGTDQLDFEGFRRHLWTIREVREHARASAGTREARSDRDKAELVFRRLDLDGDGQLSRFELEALLAEWSMPSSETARWLRSLDVKDQRGVDFEGFLHRMRPVWRFIYYDIVEARHGRREDMLVRAVTAHREQAATRGVERDLRRELVEKLPFLHGAEPAFLAELAASLVKEQHPTGTRLFAEGEAGDACWIVHQGRVSITLGGEPLGEVGEGGFLGEGALLSDAPRGATATVTQDATMYAMTSASFSYLLEKHPTMQAVVREVHEERRYANMRRAVQSELLERVPFLKEASASLIDQLTLALEMKPLDGVVFREGEPGDAFYLLGQGDVMVVRGGDLVAELSDGAYFGEGALLTDGPRSATVTTVGPAVLYQLKREAFEKVLESHQAVAEQIRAAHRAREARHVQGLLEQGLVRRISFLRGAEAEVLDELASDLEPVTVSADQVVFREGDEGDALYLIARGGVRIDRGGATAALLGPGKVFGEAALLLPQPRSASATTVESSELLKLSRAAFDRMLDAHPQMHAQLEAMRRERSAANA